VLSVLCARKSHNQYATLHTTPHTTTVGGSLCAERCCVVQLRLLPRPVKFHVTGVYIVSDSVGEYITPGVLCREFLLEYCTLDTPIVMASLAKADGAAKHQPRIVTVDDADGGGDGVAWTHSIGTCRQCEALWSRSFAIFFCVAP
jgi:cytidine deaminase